VPRSLRDSDYSLVRILICVNLIRRDVVCGRRVTSSLFSSCTFLGNIAPTNYIRRWAYPGPNGIMVIAEDRQYVSQINNLNYLKHVMDLDTNGAGARTVKRTTSVQPVASHVEL
jgi:hypothetical protein